MYIQIYIYTYIVPSSVQFSIQDQLLRKIVKRLREGLVLKAHRLLYHSTLGSRVIHKWKKTWA